MGNSLDFNGLLIPNKVNIEESGESKCKFLLSPLENGFGITIGNAFRRVLLSRIKGYAVYAIEIPGVEHEFSTINGVYEDVVEIVLNLKKLRIKNISNKESETIKVKINKNVFIGGDINNFSKNFKVVNTDLEICHFPEELNFEITLYVNSGYGFEVANSAKTNEDEIGKIYIDSIYSPVKNVAFSVNDIRVGNKLDYNSLTIDVETNGTLTSKQAMKEAAGILMKHFELFINDGTFVNEDESADSKKFLDVNTLKIKELLNKPISSFSSHFGKRALNCLNCRNIIYLKDLVKLRKDEILKIENLGDKTMDEINSFLELNNLQFGMDISKFGL